MWWEMYAGLMLLGSIFFLPMLIFLLGSLFWIYYHYPFLSILGLMVFWGSFFIILSSIIMAFTEELPSFICPVVAAVLTLLLALAHCHFLGRMQEGDRQDVGRR